MTTLHQLRRICADANASRQEVLAAVAMALFYGATSAEVRRITGHWPLPEGDPRPAENDPIWRYLP